MNAEAPKRSYSQKETQTESELVFAPPTTLNDLLHTTVPDYAIVTSAPNVPAEQETFEYLTLGTAPFHIAKREVRNGIIEFFGIPDFRLTTFPLYLLLRKNAINTFVDSPGGIRADLELPHLDDKENKARYKRHARMPNWNELIDQYNPLYEVFLEEMLPNTLYRAASYAYSERDLTGRTAEYLMSNPRDPFPDYLFDQSVEQLAELVKASSDVTQPGPATLAAFHALSPEEQYRLILEHQSAHRMLSTPKPGMEHLHRQAFLGMSFEAIGHDTLLTRIGSSYKAQAHLQTAKDPLGTTYPYYKIDDETVESTNFVVPLLRWKSDGKSRSWNIQRVSTEDKQTWIQRLGITVPQGLEFTSDKLNALAGLSVVPYVYQDLKTQWKDVRGYHESNQKGTEKGKGPTNQMMSVQTLVVLLQEKDRFINNPLIQAAEEHAMMSGGQT